MFKLAYASDLPAVDRYNTSTALDNILFSPLQQFSTLAEDTLPGLESSDFEDSSLFQHSCSPSQTLTCFSPKNSREHQKLGWSLTATDSDLPMLGYISPTPNAFSSLALPLMSNSSFVICTQDSAMNCPPYPPYTQQIHDQRDQNRENVAISFMPNNPEYIRPDPTMSSSQFNFQQSPHVHHSHFSPHPPQLQQQLQQSPPQRQQQQQQQQQQPSQQRQTPQFNQHQLPPPPLSPSLPQQQQHHYQRHQQLSPHSLHFHHSPSPQPQRFLAQEPQFSPRQQSYQVDQLHYHQQQSSSFQDQNQASSNATLQAFENLCLGIPNTLFSPSGTDYSSQSLNHPPPSSLSSPERTHCSPLTTPCLSSRNATLINMPFDHSFVNDVGYSSSKSSPAVHNQQDIRGQREVTIGHSNGRKINSVSLGLNLAKKHAVPQPRRSQRIKREEVEEKYPKQVEETREVKTRATSEESDSCSSSSDSTCSTSAPSRFSSKSPRLFRNGGQDINLKEDEEDKGVEKKEGKGEVKENDQAKSEDEQGQGQRKKVAPARTRPSSRRRSYRCDFSGCNKSFDRQSGLRSHKISHDPSPGIFVCRICRVVVKRENDFKRHKLKHSDTKNQLCKICPERFTRNDALWRHYRKEHPRDPMAPVSRRRR